MNTSRSNPPLKLIGSKITQKSSKKFWGLYNNSSNAKNNTNKSNKRSSNWFVKYQLPNKSIRKRFHNKWINFTLKWLKQVKYLTSSKLIHSRWLSSKAKRFKEYILFSTLSSWRNSLIWNIRINSMLKSWKSPSKKASSTSISTQDKTKSSSKKNKSNSTLQAFSKLKPSSKQIKLWQSRFQEGRTSPLKKFSTTFSYSRRSSPSTPIHHHRPRETPTTSTRNLIGSAKFLHHLQVWSAVHKKLFRKRIHW